MYPMEHYMKFLKDYVPTKAHPEGSMGERYVRDEILGFYTEYMFQFSAMRRHVWKN